MEGSVEDVTLGREGRKKAYSGWVSRELGEGKGKEEQGRTSRRAIGQVRGQERQLEGSAGAGHSGYKPGTMTE